jgi:hypothetical protein
MFKNSLSNYWLLICLLIFSVPLLFLTGCKRELIDPTSPSQNYFPTEIGNWVEYSVDSVYHAENDNQNDDSVKYFHFEIREVIDSSFIDGAGKTLQVIKRYYRIDSASEWTFLNVWTQMLTSISAYRTENNISYHKLAFPIDEDITWNGNDANTDDEEMYSYEYFHIPGTYQSLDFDSTLSVLQIDEDNFIEKIFKQEVYASGVGLVYKQVSNLGKVNGIVVSGYEIRMEIKDYGKDN